MKRFCLLVTCLVYFISLSISQKTNIKAQILQLHKYYNLALSYPDSNIYKEKFFELFPNDFNSFNTIYGYNDNHYESIYYSLYGDTLTTIDHIDFFCSLSNQIPGNIFYKKIINIALNGHWDADFVGEFQNCLQIKLFDNIKMSLRTLNTLSAKECLSVYHFLFDGPHPDNYKEQYEQLYQQILLRDKKQAQLLKQSYSKLLKEDHCLGH